MALFWNIVSLKSNKVLGTDQDSADVRRSPLSGFPLQAQVNKMSLKKRSAFFNTLQNSVESVQTQMSSASYSWDKTL